MNGEFRGIHARGICFERQYHYGWDMTAPPMMNLDQLTFTDTPDLG